MDGMTNRYNATGNWRRVEYQLPSPAVASSTSNVGTIKTKLKRDNNLFGSNFLIAVIITIVIIVVQLFIAHHYLGSHKLRYALVLKRDTGEDSLLARNSGWFCHSYIHLNKIAELASKHQVELVIVDEELLNALADDEIDNSDQVKSKQEFIHFSGKVSQEPGRKSIIHLAVINETSGGQPNLIAFYDDLRIHYHLLKYDDTSETIAPEVYWRQAHQLDDVQSDALRDSAGGRQHKPNELMRQQLEQSTYEISKIYTEFVAHLFILNTTSLTLDLRPSKLCDKSKTITSREPFIVIHLFVLYNYEYRPRNEWIQPNLALTEIERHRLLSYGVHSVDFGVPLSHSYIHTKREISTVRDARDISGHRLESGKHISKLRVFEPPSARLLTYANNTYLHCKRSSFNISGLLGGNRELTRYLRSLDASRPPQSYKQRKFLSDQVSIALKFMDVLSKTYGEFRFWLTGSSLLSYHKYCQLATVGHEQGNEYGDSPSYDEYDHSSALRRSSQTKGVETSLVLEIGLFSSEIDSSMLNDLSEAKMIGVTMMSNWRKPSSRAYFHVKDCPDLLFKLHFYELKRDFYQHFYVMNDSMVYGHGFKRRRFVPNKSSRFSGSVPSNTGHHVFTTSNLDLCWTRLDDIHPFRVPCDVHDHLRRIYVV